MASAQARHQLPLRTPSSAWGTACPPLCALGGAPDDVLLGPGRPPKNDAAIVNATRPQAKKGDCHSFPIFPTHSQIGISPKGNRLAVPFFHVLGISRRTPEFSQPPPTLRAAPVRVRSKPRAPGKVRAPVAPTNFSLLRNPDRGLAPPALFRTPLPAQPLQMSPHPLGIRVIFPRELLKNPKRPLETAPRRGVNLQVCRASIRRGVSFDRIARLPKTEKSRTRNKQTTESLCRNRERHSTAGEKRELKV